MDAASPTHTVLVYSSDPSARERVRVAIGRRPRPGIILDWRESDHHDDLARQVAAGGIDLVILDGESRPAGGLGLCRQLKDEVAGCPPILVLVARHDDAWLASWSQADGTLLLPVDPIDGAGTVANLLVGLSGAIIPAS
jgi:DNA-binding response OmpR family regulator